MKQKPLSVLEQEVMDIVWENKRCSVREVLPYLPQNKKYAYTTIATILNRLYKKGLVFKRLGKESYIYSAKISKESYTKTIAQSFLKRFIGSFGDTAVVSFAESIEELPKKKKKYFLKLLKDNEKIK